MVARVVFQLLDLCFGQIGLVVLPAGSILADVLGERVYFLLSEVADVDPSILIFVIVVVVEKIFGDHVLLQALLRDLALSLIHI